VLQSGVERRSRHHIVQREDDRMSGATIGFTTLDWVILVVYVAGSAALGGLFARGQKSSKDFFLAGRDLWWFPMALSVIATDFSAISFLGVPGYVVARDLVLETHPLVFLWVLPIAQVLFIRFFHRLELISAYEYLELRFNLPLRTGCSLLFICVRTGWMATALYATSLALTQVTGWSTLTCTLADPGHRDGKHAGPIGSKLL
jgi:SSS family solute:Na+ symporter